MKIATHSVSAPAAPAEATLGSLGKYDLIHRLGAGGMAEVFLARQRGLMGFEKLVVVKKIHSEIAANQSFIEMLLQEARVSAMLRHKNIVDIYDLGHEGNTYFIAMEYLAGQPLTRVITTGARQQNWLSVTNAARIIADAASGLDAAHNLTSMSGENVELIHRDISPGNIVVLYDGSIKLVDFGIAKARGEITNVDGPRMLKGKAGYVSPEQINSDHIDSRSDIFSLGVVMWETLTARRLFRGIDDGATLEKIQTEATHPPSYYRHDIPCELDRICLKALSKKASERYQQARDMRADLEDFLWNIDYDRRADPLANHMRTLFEAVIAREQQLVKRAVSPAGSEAADVAAGEPKEVQDDAQGPAVPGALPLRAARESGPPPFGKTRARRSHNDSAPLAAQTSPAAPPQAEQDTDLLHEVDIEIVDDIHAASDDRAADDAEVVVVDLPSSESSADADATPAPRIVPPLKTGSHSRRIWYVAGGALLFAATLALVVTAGASQETTSPGKSTVATISPAEPRSVLDSTDAQPRNSSRSPQSTVAASPTGRADSPTGQADSPASEADSPIRGPDESQGASEAGDETQPSTPDTPIGSNRPAARSAAAPSKTNRTRARRLYKVGLLAYAKGSNVSAQRRFRAAIAADPRFAPAHRGLGLALERAGRRHAATISLRKYLKLAPDAVDARSIRSRLAKLKK